MVSIERTTEATASKPSPIISMGRFDMARVALYGVIVGLIAALGYLFLEKFIFEAVLCRGAELICGQTSTYAAIFAAAIASIVGLVLLSRARIYRPLFIVLATLIALWGIQSHLVALSWYWAVPCAVVLCALSYVVFAWLARIRSFILYLIISIVLIVVSRIIINS